MTTIRKELLDELLAGYEKPEDLLGPGGLLKRLTGALVERAIDAELTDHLGYEKHAVGGRGTGNSRNGTTPKTLKTDQGDVEIAVPRDRAGTFEPKLVQKHQTHFDGFDDKIISMYARGMTVRDIQQHIAEIYGTTVSADLISSVTDAVMDELSIWQSRPLEAVWPILYLDAIVLKVRDQGVVRNKAVYLAIGVRLDGCKEVLGMWIADTEGAKFWLHVVTELKNRGVDDVLIVCCDGLKGFPDAIEAVFPRAIVQTCVVHMIRNSLRFVSWKERTTVAKDLKNIYTANTVDAAEAALNAFEERWRPHYPTIAQSWRTNWERVVPFLDFPKELRRIIYTTNAIESFNSQLRKVTRSRGHFPNDEAAKKLLYLATKNAAARWAAPQHYWNLALHQFMIRFESRLPA
jgi:putative transposase